MDLLEFPCDFPIKIIGAAHEDFVPVIAEIVARHVPDFDPAGIEMRPSQAGNYLSLTCTVRATSRAQLDALYRELAGHPWIKIVI